MSEETKEQVTTNTGEGSVESATSLVDRSDTVAKRLEEQNKRAEDILRKQEELYARQRLGGRSEAGTPSKPKSDDDIAQEKADFVIGKYLKK